MAGAYAQYAQEIHSALHYGATWTPGTPLKLGQTGTFENGVFVPQGDLAAIGIEVDVLTDQKPTAYTYASQNGVSLKFKAKGASAQPFQSLAEVEAGVAISFNHENAIVFSASECYEHRIANVFALQEELSTRYNHGIWPDRWAVITHLVEAGSATILFSSSANTTVELKALAALGQGPVQLGDISAGMSVSFADSMNQLIIANKGLTPLFHSLRLKRSFWTGKVRPIHNHAALHRPTAIRVGETVNTDAFERVDYDELSSVDSRTGNLPPS